MDKITNPCHVFLWNNTRTEGHLTFRRTDENASVFVIEETNLMDRSIEAVQEFTIKNQLEGLKKQSKDIEDAIDTACNKNPEGLNELLCNALEVLIKEESTDIPTFLKFIVAQNSNKNVTIDHLLLFSEKGLMLSISAQVQNAIMKFEDSLVN